MNKKITAVTLSALIVLTMFTAMVPAASAAKEVAAPYEFMAVTNATVTNWINATSADNPSIMYYDLDDKQGAESISFPVYDNLSIPDGTFNYTIGTWVDTDSLETYTSWGGEKYFATQTGASKWIINEKLVDEDNSDDYLLRVGESLSLPNGWAITAMEIDVDGAEAWMSLTLDGEEVDNEVVSTALGGNPYFLYEEDISSVNDVDIMNFTVETVFAGMNTNLVKINNIDLIDPNYIEIKNGDDDLIDGYTVHTSTTQITIDNDDDEGLTEDDVTEILGGLFAVRVNKDSSLLALVQTVIVGGGAVATQAPTAVVTGDATEEPTGDATGDATAAPTAAEPTAAATEEVPTPEPTKEPGFEAVFAIAGLLAVAYLVLRQRE